MNRWAIVTRPYGTNNAGSDGPKWSVFSVSYFTNVSRISAFSWLQSSDALSATFSANSRSRCLSVPAAMPEAISRVQYRACHACLRNHRRRGPATGQTRDETGERGPFQFRSVRSRTLISCRRPKGLCMGLSVSKSVQGTFTA